MTKFTSAAANKQIRALKEELESLLYDERSAMTYTHSANEEPVIEAYDFKETQEKLAAINHKILAIRHGVNQFNVSTVVPGFDLTIDQALVKMAMLNEEKSKLARMKNVRSKVRNSGFRSEAPEYTIRNYDADEVAKRYDDVSKELAELQMALDRVNLTETFDVDI